MHPLSLFIGLLTLSVPISGLSISATRQELFNNGALLADAMASIDSFASSLGSDDLTLDAATSMEFLSDVADFVSLGSQQVSALQAHPFVKADPYTYESLRLSADDLEADEVAPRLMRRGTVRAAPSPSGWGQAIKAKVAKVEGKIATSKAVLGLNKFANKAATKIRKVTGITSAGVFKSPAGKPWSMAAKGASAAAGAAKDLADRRGKGKDQLRRTQSAKFRR
ncbi:hypothetical protein BC829DRAFT_436302 [Chytridium lagenaria]|nr:hypothetical protein BC829DRAFT_436302 [Chytridium lagenaria]